MWGIWWSLLVVTVTLTFTHEIRAQTTHNVFPATLDDALAIAQNGDTISMNIGVYRINRLINVTLTFTTTTRGAAIIACYPGDTTSITLNYPTTAKFVNITFTECTGTAVQLNSVTNLTSFERCDFTNNALALSITNSLVNIVDTTFFNNSRSVVSTVGSTVTINRTTFLNNTRDVAGTLHTTASYVYIVNSTFKFNAATYGGAIYQSGGSLTITVTFFLNNQAVLGGAIYLTQQGTLTMSNCTVNATTSGNGAIYAQSSIVNIDTTPFSYNSMPYTYNSINNASVLALVNSNFTGVRNKISYNNGGGTTMTFDASTATLTTCDFSYNKGTSMYLVNGAFVRALERSNFIINSGTTGGVFRSISSTLYIQNSMLSGNAASVANGVGSATSSNLYLRDLAAGTSIIGGTALQITGGYTSIYNVSFSSCGNVTTLYGGCISARNATLDLTNLSTNFGSAINGGAAFFSQCKIQMTGCNLSSATVGNSGSSLYIDACTGNITNTMIGQNTANGLGGAIYFSSNPSTIRISYCDIATNNAVSGGGFYIESGNSISIEHTDFQQNVAKPNTGGSGGAIFSKGSLNLFNTTIRNCSAPIGGGVYAVSGIVTITNTSIASCKSKGQGGGLLAINNTVVQARYSTFAMNSATLGGGISLNYVNTAYLTNSTITNNTAVVSGGGVHINDANIEITLSTFTRNYAGGTGGGIYLAVSRTIYVGNTTILQNSVGIDGDGVYVENASDKSLLIMRNITITNTARDTTFCCGGVKKNITSQELCNYPACDKKQCLETTNGCECPFKTVADNIAYPVLFFANTTCTCASDEWLGPNKYCQVKEACHPNPCKANMYCTSLSNSYNCTCPSIGFVLKNGECLDINECNVNNGGCDTYVKCNNTIGGFICPPCPRGMEGNSYAKNCTKLCGNEVCQPDVGENCVTCPQDCHDTTCSACGDGKCDIEHGENCTSCLEDCQTSLCVPQCTKCVNGVCNKGACVCFDKWTGPACDVENQDVEVGTNTSTPVVTLKPNTTQAVFSIGISSLQEISEDSQIAQEISVAFGDQNFTFLGNITKGSSLTTVWSYLAVLENGASVNFTFYQFEEATNLTFADQIFTFSPHSLKLNVNVSNWPFHNIKNSLAVVLETFGDGGDHTSECGSGNTITNSGNIDHLKWIKITHKGSTLYGQFSDAAIVDGRYRNIKFSLNQTSNLVSAIVPHFWDNAEFDPSYSVLVGIDSSEEECDEKESKDNKVSKTLIIAIAAGVGGAAVLLAVTGAIVISVKRRKAMDSLKSSDVTMKESSYNY